MRITAFIEINNRLASAFNISGKSKGSQCQLSIGKDAHRKEGEVYIMICNKQNKDGTKYKAKSNIQQCFTKFLKEGKATIRFVEPPHDLCISKADSVQLKGFISVLKSVCTGDKIETLNLTPLRPATCRTLERLTGAMSIKKRSDYPLTSGFPSSLKRLQVVTCSLKKIDSRILKLHNLQSLDLADNNIQVLPNDYSSLTYLSEITLENNKITHLPKEFCTGPLQHSLKQLNLNNNLLKMLPMEIGMLRNLVVLKLHNNQLCVLTTGVSKLCKLSQLVVSANNLRTLPAGFAQLKLDSVDFYGNPFMDDGPSTAIDKLHFCTLLELSARAIKTQRVIYEEEDITSDVHNYLKLVKRCLCGNYCFQSYVHYLYRLDLRRISQTVSSINSTGRTFAPAEAFLCSHKCYCRYQQNPYATFWK